MCGYRKGFSTQHTLLSLIEKLKKTLDDKGYGGAILMDLSKAFNTIIAKLHVYGFPKESLKLIKSYLTNRWQRAKLNTGFGKWTEILLGVPEGYVLEPLLFNIILTIYVSIYLFYLKTLTFLTTQTTTFYAFDADLHIFFLRLEHDSV